jgi:predicted transcriptional regulator
VYANEDEVLRDALGALSQRDIELQAIREGIADMEAGRVMPLREFDRQLRLRKHIATED